MPASPLVRALPTLQICRNLQHNAAVSPTCSKPPERGSVGAWHANNSPSGSAS